MAGARTLLQRVCAEATAHLPTDTYLDVLAQLDLAQAQEELVRPPATRRSFVPFGDVAVKFTA